jgi:very-short-patch-repair endonuclease
MTRFATLTELQKAIGGDVTIQTPMTPEPPTDATNERKRAQADNLRHKFETLWRQLGGPPLEREFRFHPVRKFPFDYALPHLRIAIELDGGQFIRGRHQRPMGFQRDAEKRNLAIINGWQVFHLTTAMVTADHVQPIIDYILRKS